MQLEDATEPAEEEEQEAADPRDAIRFEAWKFRANAAGFTGNIANGKMKRQVALAIGGIGVSKKTITVGEVNEAANRIAKGNMENAIKVSASLKEYLDQFVAALPSQT